MWRHRSQPGLKRTTSAFRNTFRKLTRRRIDISCECPALARLSAIPVRKSGAVVGLSCPALSTARHCVITPRTVFGRRTFTDLQIQFPQFDNPQLQRDIKQRQLKVLALGSGWHVGVIGLCFAFAWFRVRASQGFDNYCPNLTDNISLSRARAHTHTHTHTHTQRYPPRCRCRGSTVQP